MTDRLHNIEVGKIVEITREITEEDLQKFCDLTGDDNPIHMDETYAAKTSFKKRVVHGMLTASFISTVVGTKMPGQGSLWMSQTIQFLNPVRIGDSIKIIAKVTHKSSSQRIIIMAIDIFNQHGQKVLEGEAKVKVLKTAEDDKEEEENIKGGAIVTGASQGIGSAIALKLAEDGFSVLVNYLSSKEEAEKVLKKIVEIGGEGCIFQSDIRNYEEVEKMVQFALGKFGKVDLLINNAASKIINKAFEQLSWEDIQEHLAVQLKGTINTCKAVIPHMVSKKRGKIINIGSTVTDNVPPLKWYSYVIAKSTVVTFTKCLALEYGPKGLNINCVSPGMTETTLIADLPEKAKMVTKMQTPLRRLAKPKDIANIISFLASDAANYLTGETIRVCGGQLMI